MGEDGDGDDGVVVVVTALWRGGGEDEVHDGVPPTMYRQTRPKTYRSSRRGLTGTGIGLRWGTRSRDLGFDSCGLLYEAAIGLGSCLN